MTYYLPFYFAYVIVVVFIALIALVFLLAVYANADGDVLTMKIKHGSTTIWDSEAPGGPVSNKTSATFGIFTHDALEVMTNGNTSTPVPGHGGGNTSGLFNDTNSTEHDLILVAATATKNSNSSSTGNNHNHNNNGNDTKWKIVNGDISESP